MAPVFSGGQVTELVGIENTARVTVRQGLALRPLFELPGGEREMHQHGDVMRTVVAAALKADFADGVAVRQVFFQHLPFLQETEAVQPRGNLRAGVEEGFVVGRDGVERAERMRSRPAWLAFGNSLLRIVRSPFSLTRVVPVLKPTSGYPQKRERFCGGGHEGVFCAACKFCAAAT